MPCWPSAARWAKVGRNGSGAIELDLVGWLWLRKDGGKGLEVECCRNPARRALGSSRRFGS